jgi:hypothetical protein
LLTCHRLIIILRPGPCGAGYEDLYEIAGKDDNPQIQHLFNDIKKCFKFAQKCENDNHLAEKVSEVGWEKVSLKFMRMEKVSVLASRCACLVRAPEGVIFLSSKMNSVL